MATIAQARERFQKKSGRYDLTTADIDTYLNSGQQYLDQLTEYQKAPTRLQSSLATGGLYVTFTARMRTIHEVWIAASGGDKKQLHRRTKNQYLQLFPDDINSLVQGEPEYYTPDPLTYFNSSGEFQFYDGAFADSFANNGLLVGPPANQAYAVEVTGRFYSPVISDSQSSWWLQQQSDTLVLAALRMLEGDYRNTQGMRDWEMAMAPLVKGIHDDWAEEESQDINVMEG